MARWFLRGSMPPTRAHAGSKNQARPVPIGIDRCKTLRAAPLRAGRASRREARIVMDAEEEVSISSPHLERTYSAMATLCILTRRKKSFAPHAAVAQEEREQELPDSGPASNRKTLFQGRRHRPRHQVERVSRSKCPKRYVYLYDRATAHVGRLATSTRRAIILLSRHPAPYAAWPSRRLRTDAPVRLVAASTLEWNDSSSFATPMAN